MTRKINRKYFNLIVGYIVKRITFDSTKRTNTQPIRGAGLKNLSIMTTYNEVRLKNIIKECGEVTITVVNEIGQSEDHTFTNFDEAKNEIIGFEIENEVYF